MNGLNTFELENKVTFQQRIFLTLVSACVISTTASAQSGPGWVVFGGDASEWSSDTAPEIGIIPVGGMGQVNGGFVTAERLGIQVGIRAQERTIGPVPVLADTGERVGVYTFQTGEDSSGRAVWNYDIHVDLRGAHGRALGTTLSDYDLFLETNHTGGMPLFDFPVPLDLTFGGFIPGNTVLYQLSQNPIFGNTVFDPNAAGTYHFNLVLRPKTFRGRRLVASMRVEVITP